MSERVSRRTLVAVSGAAVAGAAVGGTWLATNANGVASSETGTGPTSRRVTFRSNGDKIVGTLFPAARRGRQRPAVAIVGPMTYHKEQAPTQYALRLSRLGLTSLIFDPRYRGDSGGAPRNYEDPNAKVEDLGAAVDYLARRHDVDDSRVSVLGVCMGSNQALVLAARDRGVHAVATVAAHFRDADADRTWLGSDDAVAERLERGRRAQRKYERTGTVDYVPAVDEHRLDVGMPGKAVWGWYQPWADRGIWDNEYAVMSDAAMFGGFESLTSASRLTTPYLMVHSDLCAVPDSARRHFESVPISGKHLVWENGTEHFQYYDDPTVIDRTSRTIAQWFMQA